MGFKSDIAATLTEIRSETQEGNVFVWKTREVPCTASFVKRGNRPEMGGFEVDVALVLTVLMSEFVTVDNTEITVDSVLYFADNDNPTPVAGKRVVYHGHTYVIEWTRTSPSLAYAELGCNDANK